MPSAFSSFVRLVLLGALATACGGYLGVREPQLTAYNERWERRLQRTARTDLACRSVRLIPLSDSVIQADGCNRVVEYGLFCHGSRNCTWRAFEGVGAHAARDLSCHEAGLAITASGPMTRDVWGCGRTASYTLSCVPQHCTWTLAGASTPPAPIEVVAVTSVPDGATAPDSALSAGGSTDALVIPPPPGSPESTSTSTDAMVIPPPPGASPPDDPGSSGTGGSTDEVVIPPPPR